MLSYHSGPRAGAIRSPFYSLHQGLCLLLSTGPQTRLRTACRENNPTYSNSKRKNASVPPAVWHGIGKGKQQELQMARADKRLSLLIGSSFCKASVVSGQTIASGVKADLQVIQVPVLVRRTLSSPGSEAPYWKHCLGRSKNSIIGKINDFH